MPQHFVASPEWHWYIVWYFFLGGIAGGAYALGTLLRLVGDPQDEGAARTAFLVAFPTFAICPILLTLDLGQPIRFWHMLLDARTGLPDVQVLVPDVGRGVGALRVRALRHPVLHRGAGARRPAPAPAGAAGGRCGSPAASDGSS